MSNRDYYQTAKLVETGEYVKLLDWYVCNSCNDNGTVNWNYRKTDGTVATAPESALIFLCL